VKPTPHPTAGGSAASQAGEPASGRTEGTATDGTVGDAPDLAGRLAAELGIERWQAANTIELLDAQNTIPFIARYRKERTGELDEEVLRRLEERLRALRALEARRADVLRLLKEQGHLTPELERAVRAADTPQRLADLYLPFRPKRRTRASLARERGLQPLADAILARRLPPGWAPPAGGFKAESDGEAIAAALGAPFVAPHKGVATAEEAVAGALDIVAETVAENPDVRDAVRRLTRRRGRIVSRAARPEDGDAPSEFEGYYDYSEPVARIPPHRVLALNRGEKLEALRVRVEVDAEEALAVIHRCLRELPPSAWSGTDASGPPAPPPVRRALEQLLARAVEDGYRRLLAPAMEREIRAELTERAEEHAIGVFAANLRRLLLQPPGPREPVMGIDPGYRTGCKVAAVGPTGEVLDTATVFPHPPQNRWNEALATLAAMARRHGIRLVAIGNGTASRETERLAAQLARQVEGLRYTVVNEAGASVYSASPLARQELPSLDVSMRGAVSIARRLQDPLAELVKIDPQSIGVGLYQHDVRPRRLAEALDSVVESCVNHVGVELNTASPALLRRVSGISPALAEAIVARRRELGRFANRRQLLDIPRLGPKTFEQCAGFLRIRGGDEPLDATAVHPESYPLARRILELVGARPSDLTDPGRLAALQDRLADVDPAALAASLGAGVPTVRDIVESLARPGRDPREDMPPPLFRDDVLELEDLKPGMVLQGVVTNVVDFGAFVDIGVQKAGLVHVSEMSDAFIRHPLDAVSVGDTVTVRVLSVDTRRGRIALSLKGVDRPGP